MDLINTLNESVKDFYNLSAYKPDIFDEVCNDFDNWAISAFKSSKQLQELLPQLVKECGAVDSYEEWNPADYLNFTNFIVTPKGIRGLTDGLWSLGVAFTYERETGILHIDASVKEFDCLSIKVTGTVEEVSDLSEEVKTSINTFYDGLIAKYPLGFVARPHGYMLLDESSYKK